MINAYNCSIIILRETLDKSSPVYNFLRSNLVTLDRFKDHKDLPSNQWQLYQTDKNESINVLGNLWNWSLKNSHFSSLGWGGGIWGTHIFFRVNGRGISRHKQTIRGGTIENWLSRKVGGWGGGGGASEYYRAQGGNRQNLIVAQPDSSDPLQGDKWWPVPETKCASFVY